MIKSLPLQIIFRSYLYFSEGSVDSVARICKEPTSDNLLALGWELPLYSALNLCFSPQTNDDATVSITPFGMAIIGYRSAFAMAF